jgi:hypothetical protein
MYVGISKKIGGVRVGVGTKLGSGVTSNDKAEERQEIIDNLNKRFNLLMTKYSISLGYVVSPESFLNLNIPEVDLIKNEGKEFIELNRLTNDGGRLTPKRKETMLQTIYHLEDVIKNNNQCHPVQSLYYTFKGIQTVFSTFLVMGILSGLLGLFFHIKWLAIAVPIFFIICIFLHFKARNVKNEIRNTAIECDKKF